MTDATRFNTEQALTTASWFCRVIGMSTKTHAALQLAERGWKVFPCTPNVKIPMKGFTNWEDRATGNYDEIERIWNGTPAANIGLATGPSDLLVLDFDSAKSPEERSGIENFRAAFPDRKLPATYTVRTPSGGWHLYYTTPGGLRNSASRLADRVDTRGEGGYILGPGSVIDGNHYEVTNNAPIADLPEWITELLADKPATRSEHTPKGNSSSYALAALRRECEAVRFQSEGGRNDCVNRAAWNVSRFVVKDELDEEHARHEITMAAYDCGLEEPEASNAVNSGMTRGMSHYG